MVVLTVSLAFVKNCSFISLFEARRESSLLDTFIKRKKQEINEQFGIFFHNFVGISLSCVVLDDLRFSISWSIWSLSIVSKENDWQRKAFLMAIMLGCPWYFSVVFVIGSTLVSIDAGQLSKDGVFKFTRTSAKKLFYVSAILIYFFIFSNRQILI